MVWSSEISLDIRNSLDTRNSHSMFKTSRTSCSACLTGGGHTLAFVKTQAVYECCAVASSAGDAKQQHADSAADAVARYHALSELQPLPRPAAAGAAAGAAAVCCTCVACAQLSRVYANKAVVPYVGIATAADGGGGYRQIPKESGMKSNNASLCCTTCAFAAPLFVPQHMTSASASTEQNSADHNNAAFLLCPVCTRLAVAAVAVAKRLVHATTTTRTPKQATAPQHATEP